MNTDLAPDFTMIGDEPSFSAFSRRFGLIFIALLAYSTLLLGVVTANFPGISPIDGTAYVDALDRGLRGEAVGEGDTLGQFTLDLWACRGVEQSPQAALIWTNLAESAFGPGGTECREGKSAKPLLEQKPSTAYVHPPTYFLLNGQGVRAVRLVFPDADTYHTARMLNVIWLALTAWLLVVLGALWGARPWAAAATTCAAITTPTLIMAFGFVTPDATAVLVSTLVMIGVTLWWRGRMHWLLLIPVGLLTIAFKSNTVTTVFFAVIFILVLLRMDPRRTWRQSAGGATALALGALGGLAAWELLRRSLVVTESPYDYSTDPFALPLSVDGLAALLFRPMDALLRGTDLIGLPPLVNMFALLLSLAAVAVMAGAVLFLPRSTTIHVLSVAGLWSLAVGSLAFSALAYFRTGILLPPAPRYVLPAIPLMLLPLLLVAHRRPVIVLSVTACAGSLLALAVMTP